MAEQSHAEPLTLEDADVICGRCKESTRHPGNQVFRSLLTSYVDAYKAAGNKAGKMKITRQIVTSMKDEYGGRFLRRLHDNGYEEISDQDARDKVSHALRFAASQQKKPEVPQPESMVSTDANSGGRVQSTMTEFVMRNATAAAERSEEFMDEGSEEEHFDTLRNEDFIALMRETSL